MGFENLQDCISSGQKDLKQCATEAIGNIQSLKQGTKIDETFPWMAKLMETPDAAKTFQDISNITFACYWQNGAIDRKTLSKMCELMDPEESPFLT